MVKRWEIRMFDVDLIPRPKIVEEIKLYFYHLNPTLLGPEQFMEQLKILGKKVTRECSK